MAACWRAIRCCHSASCNYDSNCRCADSRYRKIGDTVERLRGRIATQFPDCALASVCGGVHEVARVTAARGRAGASDVETPSLDVRGLDLARPADQVGVRLRLISQTYGQATAAHCKSARLR